MMREIAKISEENCKKIMTNFELGHCENEYFCVYWFKKSKL